MNFLILIKLLFNIFSGRYNREFNDRKLYLAIEGKNEWEVEKAKSKIIYLIKDELEKLKISNNQKIYKTKYKVI